MSAQPPYISRTCIIGPGCRERLVPLHLPLAAPLRQHGVIMAGLSELRQPYDQGRPAPDFHLVLHTFAGRGVALIDDEHRNLATGETWVVPAGTPHRYVVAQAPWRIMWFHLADAPRFAALRGRTARVVERGFPERFSTMLETIIGESTSPLPGALRLGHICAEAVAIYLDRRLALFTGAAAGAEVLEALWGRVDADLARPWTVAALAAAADMAPSRLCRLVRRIHGRPPLAQVARLRIERARSLYAGGQRTLAEIAPQVSYATAFALSKAWKRVIGSSPAAAKLPGG